MKHIIPLMTQIPPFGPHAVAKEHTLTTAMLDYFYPITTSTPQPHVRFQNRHPHLQRVTNYGVTHSNGLRPAQQQAEFNVFTGFGQIINTDSFRDKTSKDPATTTLHP